jgi:hypothetical protein
MLGNNNFDEDGMPLDAIASALHSSVPAIVQTEEIALIKMRIGMLLIDALGRQRAEPVLRGLRGSPLREFRRALDHARRGAAR